MHLSISGPLGIEDGEIILFSDYEHDGPMWSGTGPREARRQVVFKAPFSVPPSVRVWLTMVDISNEGNVRMDVQAEAVNAQGFAAVFRRWSDTRIERVRVGWQAIGAQEHSDNWQVD
jgi:hypothetical protein